MYSDRAEWVFELAKWVEVMWDHQRYIRCIALVKHLTNKIYWRMILAFLIYKLLFSFYSECGFFFTVPLQIEICRYPYKTNFFIYNLIYFSHPSCLSKFRKSSFSSFGSKFLNMFRKIFLFIYFHIVTNFRK